MIQYRYSIISRCCAQNNDCATRKHCVELLHGCSALFSLYGHVNQRLVSLCLRVSESLALHCLLKTFDLDSKLA